MTDKQSYVCIGSIGVYRPGDAIAEGALTDERIKSLLDAGMIKLVSDELPISSPVDSVTLAWFNEAAGLQAQSWSAAVEMVLIGQLAVKLAAPQPATDPIKPEPTAEPATTVPNTDMTVGEIKAALDAKGVTYTTRDTKADLLALLQGA